MTPDQPSEPVHPDRRRLLVLAAAGAAVAACGGGGAPTPPPLAPAPVPAPPDPTAPGPTKSAKRGIAYDLVSDADQAALAPGVSWWYDWSAQVHGGDTAALRARHGMDFVPMLWNDNFDDAQIRQLLLADPLIRHLLVLNEPNLVDQANMSPAAAAAVWPRFEALASATGVQIVGPQMTWGTMPGYQDPIVWLDAFYAAYRGANGGRDPRIDCLGFHWYDYGLAAQLDRLAPYGKPFWVTEFANWHVGDGAAQIDTVAKQLAQMRELVALCEARADVLRYAWFTGRWQPDPHFTSLLQGPGELSELGRAYLELPARAA
ncbi:MAG: hypothetical protein IV093_04630 [Rubrivivax sp.]|nr:hypothetical protein [Rubrivivax sp.]